MSKQILVLGAGKSATCLIDYLIQQATSNNWRITVADSDAALALSKIGGRPNADAVGVNIRNADERTRLVTAADIVISLLPPDLHFLVAETCIHCSKNLLTASYTDDNIRRLQPAIEQKGLLFLCEIGLDPGIDHMSAMQLIHGIREQDGRIVSFTSHCGGLVAPESDNNPWHYKISWNPRNVVMAGKQGAVYRQGGDTETMRYEDLFAGQRITVVPDIGPLAWYPNRDSLDYIRLYGLDEAETFIRTTLRHPSFCDGWKRIVELKFTDETIFYDTDGLSLESFFSSHLHAQAALGSIGASTGDTLFIQQLEFLGLHDRHTLINKGRCSAMDVLQFAIEKKWVLGSADKDMIIMLHEIEYLLQGKKQVVKSRLVVKGDDNLHTAMAKTVGMPLGIAARLILQDQITLTGLRIPVTPLIYTPVLKELRQNGIVFHEQHTVADA